MQIMIEMPEGTFESVKRYYEQNQECYALCAYVANGKPLPKGHGRLVDADALEKLCYEHEIGNSAFDGEPIIAQGQYDDGDNIWKSLFDFAPTIIEADKESEDKE